jgi:putative FmdB family regulatory protein
VPTYQYRCTECGTELEVVQKFTDPALTECLACQGTLRKVYNAVGVVFKGSGFYRTDSRAAEGKKAGVGATQGDSARDAGDKVPSGDKGRGDKADKAPAGASASSAPSTSSDGGSASEKKASKTAASTAA